MSIVFFIAEDVGGINKIKTLAPMVQFRAQAGLLSVFRFVTMLLMTSLFLFFQFGN